MSHVEHSGKIAPAAWPFIAMVVIGLLVPSTGSHSLLNPKSWSLLLAALFTFLHVITRSYLRVSQIIVGLVSLALFMLLAAAFCIFIVNHPYDSTHSAADQLKVFTITILTTAMLVYWYLSGGVPFPSLLKVTLWANMLFSLAKISFVAAMLLGWLDLQLILDIGSATMTTSMGGGLIRLQMSTDIPTPFLLFFALMAPRLGVDLSRRFRFCYVAIAIVAIFFSYSRFLWASAAIGYLICLCTTARPLHLLQRLAVLVVIAGATVAYLGIDVTEELLYKRFLSQETHVSDEARVVQTEALLATFEEAPLLGEGLGGYTKESIRDRTNPHLYEVQWLAFLMQFGLFGSLILLMVTTAIGLAYLKKPVTTDKLAFLAMYGVWLLSGFTNPFMISLNSGTLYGLFLVAAWRLAKVGHMADRNMRREQEKSLTY